MTVQVIPRGTPLDDGVDPTHASPPRDVDTARNLLGAPERKINVQCPRPEITFLSYPSILTSTLGGKNRNASCVTSGAPPTASARNRGARASAAIPAFV